MQKEQKNYFFRQIVRYSPVFNLNKSLPLKEVITLNETFGHFDFLAHFRYRDILSFDTAFPQFFLTFSIKINLGIFPWKKRSADT